MAKEFVYNKVCDLGKLGDQSVEIGHYTVDGKQMDDKVYIVTSFTKKDGLVHSKATAICTVDEAKKLGALLEYAGGTR